LLKFYHKKKLNIVREDRAKLGFKTYGIVNQAEFSNYLNMADGDLWDIVIPGYDYKIRKKYFSSNDIIGVYLVQNGNHKIFMRIDNPGFCKKRAQKDIEKYLINYRQINNLTVKWMETT
jgi:hypothetical protein